ncbi:MAG: SPOR domain-containing protein [Candidatus Omnitrophica bacterium]|nr:SPOR domain-containing protein [Candidatus Omnitrophota bacterium]
MVILFCFSLGVERGRRVALAESGNAVTVVTPTPVAQTVPVKGAAAEDDDVIDNGSGKNMFEAFTASWRSPGKPALQTALPEPDKAVTAPKTVKVTPASAPDRAAKAVPPVTNKVAVRPASSGSFTVQVASYKSTQSAKREAENLKQKGYREVYVLPKGSFVIVCVGSFTTKSDASTLTRQLKNRYQDPVVRRL